MTPRQKSLALYTAGFAMYLPVASLNLWAGGQWLTINEVYFAPLVLGSMFCSFASFGFLKPKPLLLGLLATGIAFAFVFAIPNVTYPIGSDFYEAEEFIMAKLSASIYFVDGLLYHLARGVTRDD